MSRFLVNLARRGALGGLRPAQSLTMAGPRPGPAAVLPVVEALPLPVPLLSGPPEETSLAPTPASEETVRAVDTPGISGAHSKAAARTQRESPVPSVTSEPVKPTASIAPVVATATEAARQPAAPAPSAGAAVTSFRSGTAPQSTVAPATPERSAKSAAGNAVNDPTAAPRSSSTGRVPETNPSLLEANTPPSRPAHSTWDPVTPEPSLLPPKGDVSRPPVTLPTSEPIVTEITHVFSSEQVRPVESLSEPLRIPLFSSEDQRARSPLPGPLRTAVQESNSVTAEPAPPPSTAAMEVAVPNLSVSPHPQAPEAVVPTGQAVRSTIAVQPATSRGSEGEPTGPASPPGTIAVEVHPRASDPGATQRSPSTSSQPATATVRPNENVLKPPNAPDPEPMPSKALDLSSALSSEPISAIVVPQPKLKAANAVTAATSAGDASRSLPGRTPLLIRIGTVEVRASSPPSPPPAPIRGRPAGPRGFEDYHHKRSYQAWRW